MPSLWRSRDSYSPVLQLRLCKTGVARDPSSSNRSHSCNLTLFPWVCWVIWTTRNQITFERRHISSKDTATKGIQLAREWTMAQQIKTSQPKHTPGRRSDSIRSRLHRSETETRCYTYAAWDRASQHAGLARIFIDPLTKTEIIGSSHHNFVSSHLMAEALAVKSVLQAAASLDITNIKLSIDNQTLARVINDKLFHKEIGVVEDIKSLSSLLIDISVYFIPRDENGRADSLAKTTLRTHLSVLGSHVD